MTEFPLVLEDNIARTSHSIGDIQSSGGSPEYQDSGLDIVSICAPSIENTKGIYNSK